MSENIAVIDLGTNTFHLLISKKSTSGFEKVYSKKVPVKVGENGISQGKISDAAIDRAIRALEYFKFTMDRFGVINYKAMATSAFRNAINGTEVVNTIYTKTNIKVEIIDGQTEALYIHKGVSKALTIGPHNHLIIDIGGGSVEFIICNNQTIHWSRSFEIGGQRLMDKFHQIDPISADKINELNSYLNKELNELSQMILKYTPTTMIGSSGTFDTLSEIHLKKKQQNIQIETLKEFSFSTESFHIIQKEIINKDKEGRLNIPGMILMRADMIVVACCLINWVLNNSMIDEIRVSTFALKEGVLSEILGV